MATQTQIKNFIKEIAPCAQNAYRHVGKVLPSVCIGMACVESAYGTSGIMRSHNAFFGQKVGTGKTATKYWSGKFFTSKTKEEYTIGTHTTISAAFRAYDSMDQSVLNFYELLNTKLYARVTRGVDYETQMKQIKACGYMTSSTEVNSVCNLIKTYNLTQYDVGAVVTMPKQGNPYTRTASLIRKGDRNDSVRWLQYALKQWGADIIVDGIFGMKTLAAVRTYQAANGLKVDGIVGKNTIASLMGM